MEIFSKTSYNSGRNILSSEKISHISGNGTDLPQAEAFTFFLKKVFLIFQEGTCKV